MTNLTDEQWRSLEDDNSRVIEHCRKAGFKTAFDVFQESTEVPFAVRVLRAISAANAVQQRINREWGEKTGRVITLLCMESDIALLVATALWAKQKEFNDVSAIEPWTAVRWDDLAASSVAMDAFSEAVWLLDRESSELYEDDEGQHIVDEFLHMLDGAPAASCKRIQLSMTAVTDETAFDLQDIWQDRRLEAEQQMFAAARKVFAEGGRVHDAFLACHVLEKDIDEYWSELYRTEVLGQGDDSQPACVHLLRSRPLTPTPDEIGTRTPRHPPHTCLNRVALVAAAYWAYAEKLTESGFTQELRKIGEEWEGYVAARVALRNYYRFMRSFQYFDFGAHHIDVLDTVTKASNLKFVYNV